MLCEFCFITKNSIIKWRIEKRKFNYASPDRGLQDINVLNTFTLIMSSLLKSCLNINAISYTTTQKLYHLFLSCSYTILRELYFKMFWKGEI